jgi:hypothetical protein
VELRQLISVLLVFALLGVTLFALRRGALASLPGLATFRGNPFRLGRTPARRKSLESLERLTLTQHHALHLVRIQGREVVVATHPRGCQLLSQDAEGSQS